MPMCVESMNAIKSLILGCYEIGQLYRTIPFLKCVMKVTIRQIVCNRCHQSGMDLHSLVNLITNKEGNYTIGNLDRSTFY